MVIFFEILAIKRKNRSLFLSSLERRFGNSLRFSREVTTVPRFETESKTINNIRNRKRKTNEAVFVIFMSKALHSMSFPLVSFKVNSILMENGRKTRQWYYHLMRPQGIGTGAGVSAAKLFYKFNLIKTRHTDCTCKASE